MNFHITKEHGEQMMRKVGARYYVECSALKQYHLKEVFEAAIKCVLYPPQTNEIKKKKSILKFFKTQKNKDKKSSKDDNYSNVNNEEPKKEKISLQISTPFAHATDNKKKSILKYLY